jgi:hypothetical protein
MARRDDEWTYDEDILLVETVIKGVAEGRTQLDCFEEVAEKVLRTPAAVGFRWNKKLRSEYKGALDRAMSIRHEAKLARRKHREQQRAELEAKYVDPDFDKEWEEATLIDNTEGVVIALPKSRIQTETIETKIFCLTGLTEQELIELDKILDLADSDILHGLRYDIKATLSR